MSLLNQLCNGIMTTLTRDLGSGGHAIFSLVVGSSLVACTSVHLELLHKNITILSQLNGSCSQQHDYSSEVVDLK